MDSHQSDEETPQNNVKPKLAGKTFSVPVTEEEIAERNKAFESPECVEMLEETKVTPHKQADTKISIHGNSSTQVPISEIRQNEEE